MIIELEAQLEDTREQLHEHQAHLEALENGETFVPTLKKNKLPVSGKKRKSTGKTKQGPTKRRRSVASEADEEDELMESDEDLSDYSGEGDSDVDSDVEGDDDRDHENAKSSGEEPDSSEVEEDEVLANLSESDLKEKIQEAKDSIKTCREMLKNAQTAKKEAADALSSVEKGQVKIQREKNAFCSLKRSEVGRNFFVNNIFLNKFSVLSRCFEGGFPNWIKRFGWYVTLRSVLFQIYNAIIGPSRRCCGRA